jgi:hypothetical protein
LIIHLSIISLFYSLNLLSSILIYIPFPHYIFIIFIYSIFLYFILFISSILILLFLIIFFLFHTINLSYLLIKFIFTFYPYSYLIHSYLKLFNFYSLVLKFKVRNYFALIPTFHLTFISILNIISLNSTLIQIHFLIFNNDSKPYLLLIITSKSYYSLNIFRVFFSIKYFSPLKLLRIIIVH